MNRFDATIEFLGSQRAIITLNQNGEWSGSSRIDLPRGSGRSLYELGYFRASQNAACKGGTLNSFRVLS